MILTRSLILMDARTGCTVWVFLYYIDLVCSSEQVLEFTDSRIWVEVEGERGRVLRFRILRKREKQREKKKNKLAPTIQLSWVHRFCTNLGGRWVTKTTLSSDWLRWQIRQFAMMLQEEEELRIRGAWFLETSRKMKVSVTHPFQKISWQACTSSSEICRCCLFVCRGLLGEFRELL